MNPRSKHWQIVLVVAIAAVAVFFSTYKLTEAPSFWYDEGWYFQHAANLLTQGVDGLQLQPGVIYHWAITTVAYPLIYVLAAWMKAFGISVLSARSLMAIFILLFLAVAAALAKRLFGVEMAIAAAALLATFPPLYGNGKSVLGEVPGLFYMAVSLFFLVGAISPKMWPGEGGRFSLGFRKNLHLIMSGLFLGLCIVTKPIFIVFLPGFAVAVGVALWRKELSWKDVGIGALFALMPVAVWLITQFGPGDSFHTILSYYANPYYKTDLVGTVIGNAIGLLKDSSTLYTLFLLAVWAVALWLRRARKGTPLASDAPVASAAAIGRISVAEIAAFVFSVLIVAAFLRSQGWYRYIFEAQVSALIFFPNAALTVANALGRRWGVFRDRRSAVAVYSLVAALAIAGAYQTMFRSYVADFYSSGKTAYWQSFFSNVPDTESVFFYNVPEVVPFIHSRDYYQYISCAAGQLGTEELPLIAAGKPDMIVVRSDEYAAEPSRFAKYALQTTAYKYSILTKKGSATH